MQKISRLLGAGVLSCWRSGPPHAEARVVWDRVAVVAEEEVVVGAGPVRPALSAWVPQLSARLR